MAFLTVEGVYRDGAVQLAEAPLGVGEATRVLVTFLTANGAQLQQDTRLQAAEARETLRQAAFARMKKGVPLGGPPYPTREELYDRFGR